MNLVGNEGLDADMDDARTIIRSPFDASPVRTSAATIRDWCSPSGRLPPGYGMGLPWSALMTADDDRAVEGRCRAEEASIALNLSSLEDPRGQTARGRSSGQ